MSSSQQGTLRWLVPTSFLKCCASFQKSNTTDHQRPHGPQSRFKTWIKNETNAKKWISEEGKFPKDLNVFVFIHNNNQFDYIFSSNMLSVPVLDDSQGLVKKSKVNAIFTIHKYKWRNSQAPPQVEVAADRLGAQLPGKGRIWKMDWSTRIT